MIPALDRLQRWLPGMPPRDVAVVARTLMDSADLLERLEAVSEESDPYLQALKESARLGSEQERVEFLRQTSMMSGEQPAPRSRVGRDTWQRESSGKPLDQLREYKLYEILGQGAMGTVRRAVHSLLKREVAIKLLPPDLPSDKKARALERFRQEIEANGKLDHPNIVVASDAGEEQGIPFLVMEYVNGMDTGRIVTNYGPLPMAEACEIIRQAAVGLQHIYERGLVHRDLKPSNLILARPTADNGPRVKILDLGLASLGEEQVNNLTQAGMVMGTYLYMAPEQAENPRDVDIRADIYSLGCTLYELLTGDPPFSPRMYQTGAAMVVAHAKVVPPGVRTLQPSLPGKLDAIVAKMLEKSPVRRFGTPCQLAKALDPFCKGHRLTELFNAPVRAPSDGLTRLSATPGFSAPLALLKSSVSVRGSRRILGSVFALLAVLGTAFMVTVMVSLLNGGQLPWERFLNRESASAADTVPEPRPKPTRPKEPDRIASVTPTHRETAKPAPRELVPEDSTTKVPPPIDAAPSKAPPAENPEPPVPPEPEPPPPFQPGTNAGDVWARNTLKTPFRWCPPGTFTLGSPKTEPGRTDVESEAEAKLSEGFYLAECEVTQAEWTAVMKSSLEEQLEKLADAEPRGSGDRFPMYAVSYDDCVRFCERLTELDHASGQLPETWAYALPTETQWEYACRAGTTTATTFGDALSSSLANFDGEYPYNGAPVGPNLKATCAVGSYPPNNWGLCDIHGNVREWCRDAFTDIVLGGTDPQSSDGEAGRVVRGGSWLSLGLGCRSADRTRVEPTHRDKTLGFRVAVVRVTP